MLKILLIIPPFTQVNTPYPSTSQIAGYLKANGYQAKNFDLSLSVFLKIFSKEGLEKIFLEIKEGNYRDDFVERAIDLENQYINTIEPIINFLQGKNPNLAYRIVGEDFIPQSESFTRQIDEIGAFGYFGLQDKAKYYCSLVIDDLSEIIRKTITHHFGLSRYAEQIAVSPPTFDSILIELERNPNIIEKIIIDETNRIVNEFHPDIIGYSIPFPGNLLGALISAKFSKKNFPETKIAFGGGYINTELRKLNDKRIFKYLDFITYDDGELPLLNIIKNLDGKNSPLQWTRTLLLNENIIEYKDDSEQKNINHNELFPPSIDGIKPDDYVAMTEMLNPMHRIWSDGYWNKVMISHGCYWRKCSFCDVTLDYIGRYSPAKAKTIVDWMENLISQTGRTSFHFTDEAAPPSILRELSLEILRRKLPVSWWGNIRFEKAFTKDLCKLMAASGCVAVSGGLEAAGERLLKLINKGVTIEQVANVCKNFRDSGIMVHSYLMYGFPSQTEQEIIDSLEYVRQFVQLDLFQSGFWHLFTLTVHSPIAQNVEEFKVEILSSTNNPFANDNLVHHDLTGINYQKYSDGLKKALYNYMHGIGFDSDIQNWFDFEVLSSKIPKNFIKKHLAGNKHHNADIGSQVVWLGSKPDLKKIDSKNYKLIIRTNSFHGEWFTTEQIGEWLKYIANACSIDAPGKILFYELKEIFPGDEKAFSSFLKSEIWKELRETSLLLV